MARKPKTDPAELTEVDALLSQVTGEVDVYLTKKTKLDNPEYGYSAKGEKKACSWAFKKPFSPRVELEIVTGKKADELGIPAGPALRFCYEKDKAAPLVSVENIGKGTVEDVVELGNKYLKCLKTDGGGKEAAKACGLKTAEGSTYKIAGVRGSRSRKRSR